MSYAIASTSTVIATDDSTEAPTRILLIRDGDPGIAGHDKLKLNPRCAAEIIREFETQGNDLMVDWNHSVMEPVTDANTRPAAGWCKCPGGLVYVKGEGLWANVEWTPAAKKQIEDKKFKYFSPLLTFNKETGEIVRVVNFALTNIPATRNQTELMAASGDVSSMLEKMNMAGKPKKKAKKKVELRTAKAEDVMPGVEVDVEALPEEQVAEIDEVGNAITALGDMVRDKGGELADDADALTILSAVGDMLAGEPEDAGDSGDSEAAEGLNKVASALGLKDGSDVKQIVVAASKLKVTEGSYGDLKVQVETLTASATTTRVDKMIEEQVECGKLNPENEAQIKAARSLAENSPDEFTAMCEGLTPTIEQGQKVSAKLSPKNSRAKLIVAASKEFGDEKTNAAFLPEEDWVNIELKKADMGKLTDDEVKALVKG